MMLGGVGAVAAGMGLIAGGIGGLAGAVGRAARGLQHVSSAASVTTGRCTSLRLQQARGDRRGERDDQ